MTGQFITFEGGEGTGKSTQVKLLAAKLQAIGVDAIVTREPGGTSEAEALRTLLVTGATNRWTPESEALLNYAARAQHLKEVIRPALARGTAVICDRFMDSTRAYQGYAGTCPMALIDALEQAVVGATRPHLTLMFDLPPEIGLARAKARGEGEDRYERMGIAFHERLRQGFLAIARADPARCKVIDAARTIDEVAAAVWAEAEKALGRG